MIQVRVFGIALALLLAAVQLFQQIIPLAPDPFVAGQELRLGRLVAQFNPVLTAYKLDHVARTGPYDVLTFGNSSILSLGQEQLASRGRVFSMAIPGSSLGTSAALAGALADGGALAPVLVVMVENFEIFTQQVPMLPLAERWKDNARVLWRSRTYPRISGREWLHMAARLAKEEMVLFASAFNAAIFGHHLKLVLAPLFPPFSMAEAPVWASFNRDGAAGTMTAAQAGSVPVPVLGDQPQILPGYVAFDLHRLANLPGKPRVIVYESPLEPASAAHYARLDRPGPKALRRLFLDTCAQEGLECHDAPLLGRPGEPNRWTDHYHPPADVIAPFVESLLARAKALSHAVQ